MLLLKQPPMCPPACCAAGGIVRIAAMILYGVGRGLMKLVRAPRSETGVP